MTNDGILIVDDEAKSAEMVARFLKGKGYTTSEANNGADAVAIATHKKPAVVLMDIAMPRMTGTEALRKIKEELPETEVIMMTGVMDIGVAAHCMQNGAFGYLLKPVDLEMLLMEVKKAMRNRELERSVSAYREHLEEMVDARTKEIQNLNQRLKVNFIVSIKILVGLLEVHDSFLGSHLKRVAILSGEIGKKLGIPPKDITDLELAGLLHDIGTFAMPRRLIEERFESMSEEEAALVRQHPVFAQNIISPSNELTRIGSIIRSHLEHLDGTGFPDGLKGDAIPFESKILGVANSYDELVSRRRFTKEGLESQDAKQEFAFGHLYTIAGKHYPQEMVEALEYAVDALNQRGKKQEKVTLRQLQPGMSLAEDIVTQEGLILLPQGHILNDPEIKHIASLQKLGLVGNEFHVLGSR